MDNIPLDVIHEEDSSKSGRRGNKDGSRHSGRRSTAVSFDYFNPVGTQNLSDRLRRASRLSFPGPGPSDSQATLHYSGDDDDGFDLEKSISDILRQGGLAKVKSRQLGVCFERLRVVGLGSESSYQETVGSLLNPMEIPGRMNSILHPSLKEIISGFEGVVRPGDMVLVLGNPGSGCSTLLKTLTNQIGEYHRVEGERHYDSLSPEELQKHFRGDVQYCPEDDIHFPTLTVGQTLEFAAKTRAPHKRPASWASKEEYIQTIVDILLTVFGLSHTRNTFVGDAAVRGVSGGEKKRVSIAEALATRSRIAAWDNSTRGLDSSTALEFARALRIATDMSHMATIVSIYQASESVYQLFDKVCVIYEGRMAFFGPADQAKQYFINMGYLPANRQTTPDFLVSVTDPATRIVDEATVKPRPRTPAEFAEYFLKSPMGQQNRDDIELYKSVYVNSSGVLDEYRASVVEEHSRHTRRQSPYIISIPMQLRAVITRRFQMLMGAKAVVITNTIVFLFNAIMVGTTFLRLDNTTGAFYSRGGAIWFAMIFGNVAAIAEIPTLFDQRPIISRHKNAAMYHPMIESIALTVLDTPIAIVVNTSFGLTLYFLVGLREQASKFFIFWLIALMCTLTMKALYRAISASTKSASSATAISGCIVILSNLYTGYTIPTFSMKKALKWIAHLNPLRFGFEAALVNELSGVHAACSVLIPSGPGYEGVSPLNQVCAITGSSAGERTVSGDAYLKGSFAMEYSHLWRNFGFLCTFLAAFLVWQFTASEFNTSLSTDVSSTLFLRGSKKPERRTVDEEFGLTAQSQIPKQDLSPGRPNAEHNQPPKNDTMFSWHNLEYTVSVGSEKRVLLDKVMGYVAPGKMTALMGTSGAGKTTLLNVLAERTTSGVVTGQRLINGKPMPADFQSQTGYCQQMDTHLPTDTVREALLNSAKLRQPMSVPQSEKEAYVDECLRLCGLEEHADAIVGSLSVEHRKRTTIAVELAARPKLLLFLDEPTSGLDSKSAWAIIKFLKDLADGGQSILCTIHQPSAELFQAFDRLLLLKRGGKTVYFGDLGDNSTTLIRYFENNGGRTCGAAENPAEYMLEVIGAGATATSETDWNAIWNGSIEREKLENEIQSIHGGRTGGDRVVTGSASEFPTPWTNQFTVLMGREILYRWRNTTYTMAKLALQTATGMIIGFTFFGSTDGLQDTSNKIFAAFMSIVACFPAMNQIIAEAMKVRRVYEVRERPSKMYHWSAWLLAYYLAEQFWGLIAASIFFVTWYWTVGFPVDRGPFAYLAVGVVLSVYYTTLGMAIGVVSSTPEIGNLVATTALLFIMMFNGVMQPYSLLGWWKWMFRLSPLTYFMEALLGDVIGNGKLIVCRGSEFVAVKPPSNTTCGEFLGNFLAMAGGYVQDFNSTSECHICPYRNGDQFIGARYNYFGKYRWRNIGFMLAYVVFNVVTMLSLFWLIRIRRK